MYIGQKAICKPKTFHEYDEDFCRKRITMTGKVCYIHPEQRSIMVAFETSGGILRECFDPKEVQFGK